MLGVANISCRYKSIDGNYHNIVPESVTITKVTGVEAAISEEDPTLVNITKLNKRSGSIKLMLTFKGGVTENVTIKVKQGN